MSSQSITMTSYILDHILSYWIFKHPIYQSVILKLPYTSRYKFQFSKTPNWIPGKKRTVDKFMITVKLNQLRIVYFFIVFKLDKESLFLLMSFSQVWHQLLLWNVSKYQTKGSKLCVWLNEKHFEHLLNVLSEFCYFCYKNEMSLSLQSAMGTIESN